MKWGVETVFCAVILAFCISGNIDVQAAAYQIIAAETPMGSGVGKESGVIWCMIPMERLFN